MLRFLTICLIPVFFVLCGCSSTTYDIEEIEEVVEVKPDTQTSHTENIKEDKLKEDKFKDESVVAKVYAIQIGAFIDKMNADKYYSNANSNVSEKMYIKDLNGLYKVRVGNFDRMSDAKLILEKLLNMGYKDAFLVELTYSQTQE